MRPNPDETPFVGPPLARGDERLVYDREMGYVDPAVAYRRAPLLLRLRLRLVTWALRALRER